MLAHLKMECFVPMQPRSLLLQVLEEEQEGWTKLRSPTDDRYGDAKLKLGPILKMAMQN